jgi:diguanylate cyclase (GGDEF)-like protein
MEGAIEEACAKGMPLAVALMDLDEFKPINDTYGHHVGDEVLRKTASRLIRNIRMSDVVCRIGGDEFLLLMTDADGSAASQVAHRLRACIAETPVMTRQASIPASISIGYTIFESTQPVPVESLLERADGALIQAKLAGRNRVVKTD